ncbi:hypothetical protein C2E23DRAFT_308799 [Lenzites betulinus]|nr:hypothetical protein C2E23DRAFT_308799 [Lenzites betulinus]
MADTAPSPSASTLNFGSFTPTAPGATFPAPSPSASATPTPVSAQPSISNHTTLSTVYSTVIPVVIVGGLVVTALIGWGSGAYRRWRARRREAPSTAFMREVEAQAGAGAAPQVSAGGGVQVGGGPEDAGAGAGAGPSSPVAQGSGEPSGAAGAVAGACCFSCASRAVGWMLICYRVRSVEVASAGGGLRDRGGIEVGLARRFCGVSGVYTHSVKCRFACFFVSGDGATTIITGSGRRGAYR